MLQESSYISLCFRINEQSTEAIKSIVDQENFMNASKKILKNPSEPVFYALHGWKCFGGHEDYFCKKGTYRLGILYPNLSKYNTTQRRHISHHITIEDIPDEVAEELVSKLVDHKIGTFRQISNPRQIFDVILDSFVNVKDVY